MAVTVILFLAIIWQKQKKPPDKRRCKFLHFSDYMSHTLALGVTGSGKTTGIANLALDFLGHESKPGMCWCCVESGEAEWAVKIANMAGRGEDVIVWTPESGHFL